MYKSPAERRKEYRGRGWRGLTISGTLFAISATLWRFDTWKDYSVTAAIAAAIVVVLSVLTIAACSVFPRDQKTDKHTCRLALPHECPTVRQFVENHVGPGRIPQAPILQQMLAVNSDLCYLVESIPNAGQVAQIMGCFSIIPLKQGGVLHLESGDPSAGVAPENISKKRGSPKALYIGTIVGTDFYSKAYAMKMLKGKVAGLCRQHGVVKVFARPVTTDGLRLMKKYGFKNVVDNGKPQIGVICMTFWKS